MQLMNHDAAMLLGRIEYHNRHVVKGWAADLALPPGRVRIQVLEGEDIVDEFSPSLFRPDLAKQLCLAGRHGFVYPVLDKVPGHGSATLRFRFANTDKDLENSPVVVPAQIEASHRDISDMCFACLKALGKRP